MKVKIKQYNIYKYTRPFSYRIQIYEYRIQMYEAFRGDLWKTLFLSFCILINTLILFKGNLHVTIYGS